MSQTRTGEKNSESPQNQQRTNRGFEVNGQWYFELRGGGQRGPFNSEAEMQAELNEFIHLHAQMDQLN